MPEAKGSSWYSLVTLQNACKMSSLCACSTNLVKIRLQFVYLRYCCFLTGVLLFLLPTTVSLHSFNQLRMNQLCLRLRVRQQFNSFFRRTEELDFPTGPVEDLHSGPDDVESNLSHIFANMNAVTCIRRHLKNWQQRVEELGLMPS